MASMPGVLQHTFVDYQWTTDVRIAVRHPISNRVGLYVSTGGGLIGVDRARLGRERQCGSVLEGGVRIAGTTAGLELYAGYERRIDAFPVDRQRSRWLAFGFRISSR